MIVYFWSEFPLFSLYTQLKPNAFPSHSEEEMLYVYGQASKERVAIVFSWEYRDNRKKTSIIIIFITSKHTYTNKEIAFDLYWTLLNINDSIKFAQIMINIFGDRCQCATVERERIIKSDEKSPLIWMCAQWKRQIQWDLLVQICGC